MNLPLVTTQWLATHLTDKNLVLLDASMDTVIGKEPIVYHQPCCLPFSQKVDIERDFCDLTVDQIHAFPTQQQFNSQLQKLGITAQSTVVIYDNQGIYSAPRAWWIFKSFGVEQVYVLDGGLPKWISEQRPIVDYYHIGSPAKSLKMFEFITGNVCDKNDVLNMIELPNVAVLDARSAERFYGLVPEPRAGVRSGHIPQSINLPFTHVLDGYCFQSKQQLQQIFTAILPTDTKQLIFSCGSGITACILLLAAVVAGYQDIRLSLYDGSWAKWGADHTLPIATH